MKRCWEFVGKVGVDAGLVWVGDPCYVMGSDSSHNPKTWKEFCDKLFADEKNNEPLGEGIGLAIESGYGDGEYPVYVSKTREGRIAALKVVFIRERE